MSDDGSPMTLALFAIAREGHDPVPKLLSQHPRSRFELEVFRTAEAARAAVGERRHDGYLIDAAVLEGDPELLSAAAATGKPMLVVQDACGRAQERQRHEAGKIEALARLASGIAHDLSNVLTPMLRYAEMLRESLDRHDERREDVMEIQRAGERALALTLQLLTFGRGTPRRAAPLDLNTALDALRGKLASLGGNQTALSLHCGPDVGAVRIDPERLEVLLAALVSNARDAMPRGGLLQIETRLVDLDRARAATPLGACPGRYVLLSVSDEGRGMTADERSHLFEPFFTSKEKGQGTGLGLALVYGIVHQAQGHVEVESEIGRGTTVRIYWPAAT
jgi:two-component system, cell cycle sensor histidine kinase and response regulator CckA